MIKRLLYIFLSCVPIGLTAQITINAQLPPAGLVQKDQLWNLVVVNNSNNTLETTVFMTLQDAETGQTLFSANSKPFILTKGLKILTPPDVQPIQYNYITNGLSNNYLPAGMYTVCYQLSKSSNEGYENVADLCVRINIVPLSPPLLILPADKSIVESPYPQFSWLSPTPTEMFTDLTYQISVVEMMQGQTPAQAILNNIPILERSNLKTLYENYPSSFSKLEGGKNYAWRVQAYNGSQFTASTEVWMFTIKSTDSSKTELPAESYILLKGDNQLVGTHSIVDNNLYLKYYSFDREHDAILQFCDAGGKIVQQTKQKVIYGDNYFHFKLDRSFQKNQVYTVTLTDLRHTAYKTFFSIKP